MPSEIYIACMNFLDSPSRILTMPISLTDDFNSSQFQGLTKSNTNYHQETILSTCYCTIINTLHMQRKNGVCNGLLSIPQNYTNYTVSQCYLKMNKFVRPKFIHPPLEDMSEVKICQAQDRRKIEIFVWDLKMDDI